MLNRVHNRGGITQINRDHFDLICEPTKIRILSDRTLSLRTKNLDAATNEILSKIRTVLPTDPCDECLTVGHPAIVPSEAPFNDAGAVT